MAEDLTLHYLRRFEELDRMAEDMREIKGRLGIIEQQSASISNRIDRIETRLDRIEKRMELVES
jgi:archaellum component FlaC